MSHPANVLADATVEAINVADRFSVAVASVRSYVPILDTKGTPTLRVAVVPRAADSERKTRTQWQREYLIDVVVQKKVANALAATLDPLMDLADEIAEWFRDEDNVRPFAAHSEFHVAAVTNDPLYSQDLLDKEGLFAALVTLTFREVR